MQHRVFLVEERNQVWMREYLLPKSQSGGLSITPLQEDHARQILEWEYDPPYDFYNPPKSAIDPEVYVKEFLNRDLHFHAVMGSENRLIGFCSFGRDGQVPGGTYTDDALDIGLGMKPSFTGQGLGPTFFEAIVNHARIFFNPSAIRLTVADFNERAMTLYKRFGFKETDCFRNIRTDIGYKILKRDL